MKHQKSQLIKKLVEKNKGKKSFETCAKCQGVCSCVIAACGISSAV